MARARDTPAKYSCELLLGLARRPLLPLWVSRLGIAAFLRGRGNLPGLFSSCAGVLGTWCTQAQLARTASGRTRGTSRDRRGQDAHQWCMLKRASPVQLWRFGGGMLAQPEDEECPSAAGEKRPLLDSGEEELDDDEEEGEEEDKDPEALEQVEYRPSRLHRSGKRKRRLTRSSSSTSSSSTSANASSGSASTSAPASHAAHKKTNSRNPRHKRGPPLSSLPAVTPAPHPKIGTGDGEGDAAERESEAYSVPPPPPDVNIPSASSPMHWQPDFDSTSPIAPSMQARSESVRDATGIRPGLTTPVFSDRIGTADVPPALSSMSTGGSASTASLNGYPSTGTNGGGGPSVKKAVPPSAVPMAYSFGSASSSSAVPAHRTKHTTRGPLERTQWQLPDSPEVATTRDGATSSLASALAPGPCAAPGDSADCDSTHSSLMFDTPEFWARVDELKTHCVGRGPEIEELVCLLGLPQAAAPPIVVAGPSAAGKTFVVRRLLPALQYPHAYVSMPLAHNRSALFKTILRAANPDMPPPLHCDHLHQFSFELRLRLARRMSETFYIVLDGIERMFDGGFGTDSAAFLTALLEIPTSSRCNVAFVLISGSLGGDLRRVVHAANALVLPFPRYSEADIISILVAEAPSQEDKRHYRKFATHLIDLYRVAVGRDLREFKYLAARLYPVYKAELTAHPDKNVVLLPPFRFAGALEQHFVAHHEFRDHKASFESAKVHTIDHVSAGLEKIESLEILAAAEIPYYAKVLLVAAFLASSNPPEHDVTVFSTRKSKARKRRASKSLASAARALHGSLSFELERLLWIFRMLVANLQTNADAATAFREGALPQVTLLESLKMLVRASGPAEASSVYYRCSASEDYVRVIAKKIGIDVSQYLWN